MGISLEDSVADAREDSLRFFFLRVPMGADAFTDVRQDSSKGSRKVWRCRKRILLRMLEKIPKDSFFAGAYGCGRFYGCSIGFFKRFCCGC